MFSQASLGGRVTSYMIVTCYGSDSLEISGSMPPLRTGMDIRPGTPMIMASDGNHWRPA